MNSKSLRRVVLIVLPVLVLAYAAALRFDAITQKFGTVDRPSWVRAAQVRLQGPLGGLRPSGLTWEAEPLHPHRDGPPTLYFGDPYTYLRYAREMTSFYAAHYREPGYPFVTKVSLWLLENQDVAVSFGSVACSVLAVLATYLLGALAFSRWVGLCAALGMAIDADVIGWSAAGGRDDLFTFTVVMFALALVAYVRQPTWTRATLLGVCGGASCLVRITAPSYILPALLYAFVATKRPWRERLRQIGLSAVLTAAIVGPYVVNCWMTFGKPFYALDGPAGVYQEAEGQKPNATAATYVGSKLVSQPFQTLDTIAEGLTTYPFQNKWHGFDPWMSGLGAGLSWAALVGLVLLVTSEAGRGLLVVLATTLLPYSLTWKLSSEWRLTEVAYPFFLMAAFFVPWWMAQCVRFLRTRGLRDLAGGRWRRPAVAYAVAFALIAIGWYCVAVVLPARSIQERLAAGEDVTISTGRRDTAFFGEGWSGPTGGDVVILRNALASRAVVWLPLPGGDFTATVRLDPFPRPADDTVEGLPTVFVLLNKKQIGKFPLKWNPERVGSYDLVLPRAIVRQGANRLELVAMTPDGRVLSGNGSPAAPTFSIWYVRVRPVLPPSS